MYTVGISQEEIKMGERAKAFAEMSEKKLTSAFQFITENIESVQNEVTKLAYMNESDLEDYLSSKGEELINTVINVTKKYAQTQREEVKAFPFFADAVNERADRAENAVTLIKSVLDDTGVSGWGKFKSIVKELVRWMLRLLIKVGAIVLKIACTLIVGVIKLGTAILDTSSKAVKALHEEINSN